MKDLKKAFKMTSLLSKKISKQIIKSLKDGDSLTVTEIHIATRLNYATVRNGVSLLSKYGIITKTRQGKEVYVSLNIDRLETISDAINTFFSKPLKNIDMSQDFLKMIASCVETYLYENIDHEVKIHDVRNIVFKRLGVNVNNNQVLESLHLIDRRDRSILVTNTTLELSTSKVLARKLFNEDWRRMEKYKKRLQLNIIGQKQAS